MARYSWFVVGALLIAACGGETKDASNEVAQASCASQPASTVLGTSYLAGRADDGTI